MSAPDFVTQLQQLGIGGIDLKRSIDLINPLRAARLTNWIRNDEGRIQLRPGLFRFAYGSGGNVHTIRRVQAALAGGEFSRYYGIGGAVWTGDDGALARLDSGYSGLPWTTVKGHPPLSGDAWLYLADGYKMTKIRVSDNLVMPIGLAPPDSAVVASLASDAYTQVDGFDLMSWTNNAGTGGTPSNSLSTDAKVGAYSGLFTTAVGSATGGYYNFWGKANVKDLSLLTGTLGIIDSTDDDVFHLWLKVDLPGAVNEVRIYFVVSNDFDATVLPGVSTTKNTNSYVKTFIPAQFTTLVEASSLGNTALSEAVLLRQMEDILKAQQKRKKNSKAQTAAEQQDEERALAARRLALGRGQWTEFGSSGTPLRRGEFLRIGGDSTLNWSDVTGIIVYVATNSAVPVNLQLDDFYLRGGYEPDTSAATSVSYDYVYRHYDPRTGAKSRFSPLMAEEDQIDPVRQAVKLIPEAYGDAAIRQQFFRRGGTLPTDFYFIGQNQSDGGCGKDNVSDAVAVAAGADSDVNYHQPVTTVDRDGNAVYGQPIPVIFGPVDSIMIGLGDPYRPGHVYWSFPEQYDHWPLANNYEVCSPDEELMNGGVYGGQAFCFSRLRMYGLLVSIVDGKVKPQPTQCAKGLAGRYGLCVTMGAIYFVSLDGVQRTTGGPPESITDDLIQSLFLGVEKNGYKPIDWNASGQVRLWDFQNELWFTFQDTGGDLQTWVYSVVFQFWRHYSFGKPVISGEASEIEAPQLLLGSATSGVVYSHEGFHDDGLSITGKFRSGALNQGIPRQDKLYGDLELEMDLRGSNATVTIYTNQEGNTLTPVTVVPLIGPQVYIVDPFGSTPLLAKDLSFDVEISSAADSPWIGRGGPSAVPQPESSIRRLTDWDPLSSYANKFVKGLLLDVNTFGYQKVIDVMVDGGSTAATSFTVSTPAREQVHIAFTAQVEARSVRLVPQDSSVPWLPYSVSWLFDLDPYELTRWETQPTDHGVPLEQTLLDGYVTLRSDSDVTMTVTAWREDGSSYSDSQILPSTGGVKRKVYVKLPGTDGNPILKGTLFKYEFTSTTAHRLYREESVIRIQPWGADDPVQMQPFGTDALDVGRIVRDAEGAERRGQRWLDTSQQVGQE